MDEPNWNEFDAGVVAAARQGAGQGTAWQNLVRALLVNTVRAYRRGTALRRFGGFVSLLWILPLIAGAVWGALALGKVAADRLSPDWSGWLQLGLGVVLLGMFLATRSRTRRNRIDLHGRPVSRFRLGRLETLANLKQLTWCGMAFAALFGLQVGLLQFADVGFDERYSSRDSLLLTVDNVLHGILLDICELYRLRLGPEWEHNGRTATLFLLFRLAYDVLVGYSLYLWYRSHSLMQMLRGFPQGEADRAAVCLWIDDVLRDADNWTRPFAAECVFLQMVRAYLEDRFADAAELHRVFPVVKVSPPARKLFQGPDGNIFDIAAGEDFFVG